MTLSFEQFKSEEFSESQSPEAYSFTRPGEARAYWDAHTRGLLAARRVVAGNALLRFVLSRELIISHDQEQIAELGRDHLTGLPYRGEIEKAFNALAQHEWHAAPQEVRSDNPDQHSLVLIDIDHFKKINDTQGHQRANEMLQSVARLLISNTRNHDMVGRFGGDEMLLLLRSCNDKDAFLATDKIRLAIYETVGCTVSCGVTELDFALSFTENFVRVDDALYEAKRQGRDQVVIA